MANGPAFDFFQRFRPRFQDPLDAGRPGIDRFQEEALRTGPSPFTQLAEQLSLEEEAALRDRTLGESRARGEEAIANLAARGGITSGARERVETGAAQAATLAGQEAGRQGIFERLRLQLADEEARQAQLRDLAGLEFQAEQAEQQFSLDEFNTLAQLFGAEMTARAQEEAARQQARSGLLGQQGGFLGTGIDIFPDSTPLLGFL